MTNMNHVNELLRIDHLPDYYNGIGYFQCRNNAPNVNLLFNKHRGLMVKKPKKINNYWKLTVFLSAFAAGLNLWRYVPIKATFSPQKKKKKTNLTKWSNILVIRFNFRHSWKQLGVAAVWSYNYRFIVSER